METKTVSELAELFGVTRQAMNKRVKALAEEFVEKNEKNVTVVTKAGILELENLYGKVVTAEAEVVDAPAHDAKTTEIAMKSDDASTAAYEMIAALMQDKNAEIERLNTQLLSKDTQLSVKDDQLSAKDTQIAEKDAQLKKQQELIEKTLTEQNKIFSELQESLKNSDNAEAKGFFGRLFKK